MSVFLLKKLYNIIHFKLIKRAHTYALIQGIQNTQMIETFLQVTS